MRSRYINTQQPGRLRWSPVEALRRAWHSITGTRRQQTRVDPAAPWGACAHYQDYCREREAYRKARSYEASIGSYVQEAAVRVRDRQGKSFRPSARRQER